MSALWQPEPGWRPAPGGPGGARAWWAERGGRAVVVKRLEAPGPGDQGVATLPDHPAYWRREADVALDGALADTAGIRCARVLEVSEDDAGLTLVVDRVSPAPSSGLAAARALGVFAGNGLAPTPWWCRDQLGVRLEHVAGRGGWPTLARTTLADVADRLWERRRHHLAVLAALPQVPSHGDPTPANLPGREEPSDGGRVIGIDWSGFGIAALGADLGYLSLSTREGFDVLLDAYAEGLGAGGAPGDPERARIGAAVTATYTALTRTEWALARVAAGPGALAGKYRHPSVAPYIRALQRLLPQLEALL